MLTSFYGGVGRPIVAIDEGGSPDPAGTHIVEKLVDMSDDGCRRLSQKLHVSKATLRKTLDLKERPHMRRGPLI
jgi:hypothetical protein